MKKGNWHGSPQYIYQHADDEKAGIPPLFVMECKITDIDFSRIKSIDKIQTKFTLNNP